MRQIRNAITCFNNRKQFASVLGVSYVIVCRWISCVEFPSTRTAIKIEKITDGQVTARDILVEKILIQLERARRKYV